MGKITVFPEDEWFFYREGEFLKELHRKKLRALLRQNLADLITQEAIFTCRDKELVTIPLRVVAESGFKLCFGGEQVGHRAGDLTGVRVVERCVAGGTEAGKEAGEDYFEGQLTVEELTEVLEEELRIPAVRPVPSPEERKWGFGGLRPYGIQNNVDAKSTLLVNLKRNSLVRRREVAELRRVDFRFRWWEEDQGEEGELVVLAMMDTSGSMSQTKKFLARSALFWIIRLLTRQFSRVDKVFLTHHVESREVSEEEFFTKGESGGTRFSSVYELALRIISRRYSGQQNIIALHFSDGDNLPSDNEKCLSLVKKLAQRCFLFGYAEVAAQHYRPSSWSYLLARLRLPPVKTVVIREKREVLPAIKSMLSGVKYESN